MGFAWLSPGTIADGILIFGATVAAAWIGRNLAVAFRATRTAIDETLSDRSDLRQIRQFEGGMLSLRGERLDVEAEARWVMAALHDEARAQGVDQGVAVTPALAVWMDKRAFRKLLVESLSLAIGWAPRGHVLLTASPHGGRIQIGILHDGPSPPREAAELALRTVAELAAFHGGTLEVVGGGGRGATTVIRLPEPPPSTVRASEGRRVARRVARPQLAQPNAVQLQPARAHAGQLQAAQPQPSQPGAAEPAEAERVSHEGLVGS